jgi:hypothetical protein
MRNRARLVCFRCAHHLCTHPFTKIRRNCFFFVSFKSIKFSLTKYFVFKDKRICRLESCSMLHKIGRFMTPLVVLNKYLFCLMSQKFIWASKVISNISDQSNKQISDRNKNKLKWDFKKVTWPKFTKKCTFFYSTVTYFFFLCTVIEKGIFY